MRVLRKIASWVNEWIIGEDLPQSTAYVLPLLAAGAAMKLFGGFMSGRSKKKQAEALKKAKEDLYKARKAQFEGLQARRGSKLDAIQAAIGNVGGSLAAGGAGAPNYQFDPAALERMKAAVQFAETPESQQISQGDPTAGIGSAMVGGFASGLGDTLMSAGVGGAKPTGGFSGMTAPVPGQGGVPMITGNEDLGLGR